MASSLKKIETLLVEYQGAFFLEGDLEDDWSLVISFNDDPAQTATFREGSRTTAQDIEKAFDKATMSQKRLAAKVEKETLRMPIAPEGFDPVIKGQSFEETVFDPDHWVT